MKKDALAPLTEDQVAALAEFRARHGRKWKTALDIAWQHASEPGALQQLRNSHGPSWLYGYKG